MKQTPAEIEESIKQKEAIAKECLQHFRRGESAFWAGVRLDRSRSATTFRIGPDGSYQKIDGPFAETKEVLGGFATLSSARDEAFEWTR